MVDVSPATQAMMDIVHDSIAHCLEVIKEYQAKGELANAATILQTISVQAESCAVELYKVDPQDDPIGHTPMHETPEWQARVDEWQRLYEEERNNG